jgi:hypothetical protein
MRAMVPKIDLTRIAYLRSHHQAEWNDQRARASAFF